MEPKQLTRNGRPFSRFVSAAKLAAVLWIAVVPTAALWLNAKEKFEVISQAERWRTSLVFWIKRSFGVVGVMLVGATVANFALAAIRRNPQRES